MIKKVIILIVFSAYVFAGIARVVFARGDVSVVRDSKKQNGNE